MENCGIYAYFDKTEYIVYRTLLSRLDGYGLGLKSFLLDVPRHLCVASSVSLSEGMVLKLGTYIKIYNHN